MLNCKSIGLLITCIAVRSVLCVFFVIVGSQLSVFDFDLESANKHLIALHSKPNLSLLNYDLIEFDFF